MSLNLPKGFAIVFEPVTHSSLFLEVDGEETRERRNLSLVFADAHTHSGTLKIQPGPARISFENKAARRTMPGIWLHSEEMDKLTNTRRPFLTATRLLSNQAFRDLYRSGTFDPEQRFKITSLTILFTDLRGSTALYDRIGDLAAFDLVRSHFGALLEAVSAEGGAVVKTIGDAVMATFPTPDRALRAAMRMREAMREDQPDARRRGPGAQYRAAFGSVPRRHARRPAGLFRPDGQHRLARERAGRPDRDPGDQADHRKLRGGAGAQRSELPDDPAVFAASGTERRVRDLRGSRTRGRRRGGVSEPVVARLSAGGLLPAENLVAFAIENAQGDGVGRPGGDRGGDDRGGDVGGANLVLAQYRRSGIGSRAHELDAERLRRRNAARFRLAFRLRLRLRKGRALRGAPGSRSSTKKVFISSWVERLRPTRLPVLRATALATSAQSSAIASELASCSLRRAS